VSDLPFCFSALDRKQLMDRLELESNLQHGFRLLLLCILMFGAVVYSSMLETRAPVRLGTLHVRASAVCVSLVGGYVVGP
jgi:hypothetical protein